MEGSKVTTIEVHAHRLSDVPLAFSHTLQLYVKECYITVYLWGGEIVKRFLPEITCQPKKISGLLASLLQPSHVSAFPWTQL